MPDNTEKSITGTENTTYLPDFCDGDVFLRLLLAVELIAIVFALVSYGGGNLWIHIGLISVVMLWVGLTTAALGVPDAASGLARQSPARHRAHHLADLADDPGWSVS